MRIDWSEYLRVHADRANLVIHIIAVPMFIGATALLIVNLWRGEYVLAFAALMAALIAMALQGNGHQREQEPSRPFSGSLDFLQRWFTEQFVIFPLFFLSGRWWKQYRAAGHNQGHEP